LRKCLLAVQGPLQLIAGLIAMEWYDRVKHCSSDTEVTLLVCDLLVQPDLEAPLEEIVKNLSVVRRWKKIVFISGMEMSQIMKRRYAKSVLEFRSLIGETSFDEIFAGRDFAGVGNALVLNAYPDAARIIYGDSFGYVGYQDDLSPKWTLSLKSARTHLVSFVRKILFGSPNKFRFDAAVLTLPVDWSGDYLRNIPLLIPDKGHALKILSECSNQLPGLNVYCDSLLEGTCDPHVVLLSNLSRAGFMSVENEIGLYVETIQQTVPAGATILLKPHPRAPIGILTSVLKAIGAEYRITLIDDARFSRIPIELWVSLIRASKVVTIVSSSGVYLKYFYGTEVNLPLSDGAIRQYFYPEWISYIAKVNTVIRESLHNLKEWDGKSPLWKAPGSTL